MNEIVNKRLKITLKSDLICGSGEGWGNIIDRDIIYDEQGFPYIPARRIRGLLKEALWEMGQFGAIPENTYLEVFGDEEHSGHHFALYNGILENLDVMKKEAQDLGLSETSILSYYTTTRYQTSIANKEDVKKDKNLSIGVAKENSLRTSRAIKRGQVFYADLECESEDLELLKKCASLVRHAGSSRSRGFGEVKLEIVDVEETKKTFNFDLKDEQEYKVVMYLKNQTQLSVTSTKGEKSLDYISGSSILGYFAKRYLESHPTDERFYDLFVKGHLKFQNAYISDEDYQPYMPVRESLYREKTGERYYDKSVSDIDQKNNAPLLSKVNGKYIQMGSQKAQELSIKEVNTEIYYHHRRPKDPTIGHPIDNSSIEKGAFYQLEVVSANQHFVGSIIGKGKDLKEIIHDFPQTLQIGKSKTTQYGNVKVENVLIEEFHPEKMNANEEVVCTLLSPFVQLNPYQESDLNKEILAELCHLDLEKEIHYYLGYTKVGGYHAKWQLQKPSYVAFSAGTCIKGFLKEPVDSLLFGGEFTQEGNGVILIQKASEISSDFLKKQDTYERKTEKAIATKEIYVNHLKHLLYLNLLDELKNVKDKNITSSFVGRVLKMLESKDMDQFNKDLANVKDDEKRTAVEKTTNDIQVMCNDEYRKSELSHYLDRKEEETYKKQLYLQMYQEYFIAKKVRGRS